MRIDVVQINALGVGIVRQELLKAIVPLGIEPIAAQGIQQLQELGLFRVLIHLGYL
jgi:hypothetical protein